MAGENEILNESEAAAMLRVSADTLQRLRLDGKPVPPYRKLGGAVRYDRQAILRWIAAGNEAR